MHSCRRVPRSLVASGMVLGIGLLSHPAFAVTPNIVGAPRVANPRFGGVANTMMYTVSVTVDGAANDTMHDAQVGYITADEYTTCNGTTGWKYGRTQRFDTTTSRTWTLYNFIPGESYYYRVQVGSPAGIKRTRCGMLRTTAVPTPELPENLGYLNLQYAKTGAAFDTDYVLFETDDCGGSGASGAGADYYLVAVDPRAESIVWYMDVSAISGGANGTGFRYQAAASPQNDRILMTVDKRWLYEFRFDGTQVATHDFASAGQCDGDAGSEGPCIHHDAWKSDTTGRTYVLATQRSGTDSGGTLWEDNCGTDSLFLNDGFQVLNAAWSVTSSRYLMTTYGYDPAVDPGPNAAETSMRPSSCDSVTWNAYFDPAYGSIDWTHVNSLAAVRSGTMEVLDISLKEWDQVLRVNSTTGALIWRLSANASDSDWGTLGIAAGVTGDAAFADQHDVHATATNTIMLYDNQGDPTGARVLEIGLVPASSSATINKSWALVDDAGDPLTCNLEGSGNTIPGSTRVLAMCNDVHSISELVDDSGNTGSAPPLYVYLPDGTTEDFCTSGGPTDPSRIRGWQRAFPLASIGEF
jgi:hypothetical protein